MNDNSGFKTIHTIDGNYFFPRFAAIYMISEGDRVAFIDNNTTFAVPAIMRRLEELGRAPEDVEYIILTHVHLDHAGGTAALAKECPNAIVLAHERAARHIIDPERLINGATAVYGETRFAKLYGTIDPVDEKRIRIVHDRETISLDTRELTFIYTLGHAKHHMAIYDSGENVVFAGDSFGLSFPFLQKGKLPFIFPSSSPPDFDPPEALKSLQTIIDTGASAIFPTHFGVIRNIKQSAEMLSDHLNRFADIINRALKLQLEGDKLDTFCLEEMTTFFHRELQKCGIPFSPEIETFLEMDIKLNAMGLSVAVQREES